MELEELKSLWKEENIRLENKVKINFDLLKNMTMEKSTSSFKILLQFAIVGKYLAIVYGVASLYFTYLLLNDLKYSIPGFIGSLLMFYSFYLHRSLKQPSYEKLSIVELQKVIFNFRIHTANMTKYDLLIVAIWILTIYPMFLKINYNINFYSSSVTLSFTSFMMILLGLLWGISTIYFYKKALLKLKASELDLKKIIDLE